MSRDPNLPDDLDRLGGYLEAAASASMRRRARRQTLMNAVGAVVLAVPFALAVAAADLSPGDAFSPPPAAVTLGLEPPASSFIARHIRAEPLPPAARVVKSPPRIDSLGRR